MFSEQKNGFYFLSFQKERPFLFHFFPLKTLATSWLTTQIRKQKQ